MKQQEEAGHLLAYLEQADTEAEHLAHSLLHCP